MLAYFDCFSGISGDMTLGAFVDLGVPADWLAGQIGSIPLSGFDIRVSGVKRNGIAGKSVQVVTDDPVHSRTWADIEAMIRNSPLPERVVETSLEIFGKIAAAEAGIHGCAEKDIHFHEVGAVDAIVDIVGAALCVDYLGITRVVASRIPLSRGWVTCAHGTLPVPAPATVSILKGIPVYGTEIDGETVTPTGAAIVATLADGFGPVPDMTIENIGYGAGTRDFGSQPSLLRIITGEPADGLDHDRICVVESAIDDMNPEFFGFLMERLFADGALDVVWMPVYMKKNRPGTLLQVLCTEARQPAVIRRILSETTTSGVRHYTMGRSKMPRAIVAADTAYGRIPVKRIQEPDGGFRMVPEYEVCRKIALERDIPIRIVYDTIARQVLDKPPGRL